MRILGLTGSIAMGKSHAARMFRALGVPVHDSDAAVHRLYAPGGEAVARVQARFPRVLDAAGGIDRDRLATVVLASPTELAELERIVHELVRRDQRAFLARQCRQGRPMVALDVPLLYEIGGERRMDRVAVVSANPLIQRQRALHRGGMTEQRLARLMAKQMPDTEKRRRADYVIAGGRDRGATEAAIRRILEDLAAVPARAWPDRWLGETRGKAA
jgi:dephospho-CoA kinase